MRKRASSNRVRVPVEDTPAVQACYDYRFREIDQASRDGAWKVIAKDLYRRLGDPRVIVDMAAGRGEFLRSCPSSEKWAVDLVRHSWSETSETRFVQGDALEVDLPPHHFDAVFVSNFLEHLKGTDEVLRLLKRANRSLKIGGVVGILGPNFKYAFREYYDFSDHSCALTERSVDELLHLAGFETETLIPQYLPFSFRNRLPSWPWLVGLYLHLPFLWRLFGKQFLIVARKVSK